ncbi:MAG: hypothetical protein WBA89_11795 [Microcoleus sp.]|uniref:hypothetical protein n=1 Tax=Microcoleus sp. TaxID=44472 RepID=UPI003C730C1D
MATRLCSEVVGTENDSAVETASTETFVGPKADWSIENIPNPDLVLDPRTLPVNPKPLATNKQAIQPIKPIANNRLLAKIVRTMLKAIPQKSFFLWDGFEHRPKI